MDSLHTYQPSCIDLLGDFEVNLEEEHRQMMRKEIKEEITHRDDILSASYNRTCTDCGGLLYAHGRSSTISYLASCGKIEVRLRRLYCTACGHIVVPGKALIPQSGISAVLAERVCDLVSKMSYAKAAESLFIQHDVQISPKRLWVLVQEEFAGISDVLAGEAYLLYETGEIPDVVDLKGEKPLIIGIDGGWVRGWRSNHGFEVKCATLATGSSKGLGQKRHLNDRVGYAANCSIDNFRKRISVLAIKCGYMTASKCIFVSDGAHWISKMVADYFPDAIHVLDLYHLKHKVTMLFGIKAADSDADLRDAALLACDSYDPDMIVALIDRFKPIDDTKANQKADLLDYVTYNAKAILNHKLVSIHGSGWIEKGVDLMISRRMKNRGMAWTKQGSSHIIPLAVLRYNNQWDVYWNTRKGLDALEAA